MDPILDTIDQALRRKGLSDAAASKLAVGHPSLIKNLRMPRDGEKRYNLPALQRLAEVLDLEFYFGPRRDEAAPASTIVKNMGPDEDAPVGFLILPWAQPGLLKGGSPIAFSRAWLDFHGLIPDFLSVAVPDAIEIDLATSSDSIALLDTRTAQRKGHDLWCYREAGRTIVSHITFSRTVTVIQAIQPGTAPRIIEGPPGGAVDLLGRVVWLGHALPLKGTIG